MSARVVVILVRARVEIEAADAWWRIHHPASSTSVVDELERALALLSAHPDLGARVPGRASPGDRRLLLRRIGYHVYYRVRPGRIEVLRFWHTSRGAAPSD